MSHDRFNQLLTALCNAFNAPDLAPGGDDGLALAVDGDLRLFLELDDDAQRILLRADIWDRGGQLPPGLGRMLCAANLNWQGTGGATLGADMGGVCLLHSVPIAAHDGHSFVDLVEAFLNLAEHWRDEIRSFTDGEAQSGDQDAPEVPFDAIRI